MNHQDALQEMAVERYLLGELNGASLESFEEHLFECSECALDVKSGGIFIDGARTELEFPRTFLAPQPKRASGWTSWLTSPWTLGPALAACMVLLGVQTFILQPRMKLEASQAQVPSVLNPLVLANAGPRGGSIPEIAAPANGSFVISLDIPTTGGFSSYLCSLHAPDGSLLWKTTISPEQARDALLLNIPAGKTREGLNSIVIQGSPANGSSGGTLEDLATYRFQVRIQK